MIKLAIEQQKAILNPKAIEKNYHITRFAPTTELSPFINHYWIIHWDLQKNKSYQQDIIPHPCVNMIIQKGNSRIGGVVQKKFSYKLFGKDTIFAVMFRPAGFYPFFKKSLSLLTNKTMTLDELFHTPSNNLENEILKQKDDATMVKSMEQFLIKYLPQQDPHCTLVNDIVDTIASDRNILKVDDLVNRFSLGKRSLQRLFKQYVGVSPKWVINRYRLQDAADKLATGAKLSDLALELGYYDQTHFIKDFKNIISVSPLEYKKSLE